MLQFLDWFAETTHYVNGIIPVGKNKHCIISFDDGSLMALTVKGKKNISKIDKAIDYILDYSGTASMPEAFTLVGQVSVMEPEILGYFREGCGEYADLLKEYGYNKDVPVYELTLDASSTKLGGFALLGFCIFMVFLSGWLLSNSIKNKKAEKQLGTGSNADNDMILADGFGADNVDDTTVGVENNHVVDVTDVIE